MNTVPKMMTVKQIAATGLLPENAIRVLLKQFEAKQGSLGGI